MDKQDQKVTKGAVAIQSGGDTIFSGLTPADMAQILETLGSHLTAYTAVAREIVDARLADFERRILERFSDTNTASPEAFKDPDFQYLLTRAQHAYVRSGDEIIRDTRGFDRQKIDTS